MSEQKGREEKEGESAARGSGPMSLMLPPETGIWNESRRLVADKNIRVEDLALCAGQDPVIVMDLLRISNALFFAGGRSPITSAKTAIMRLGSDVVLETLEKMGERRGFEDPAVTAQFELHRTRCRRASFVASILADSVARTLAEDCQVVGLLLYVGEMLAVAHFKQQYVKLATEHARSAVNYRLANDLKFDVEKMGVAYLRRGGIPEALLFALDRDARPRAPERAVMKPICMAAAEMLDSFDAGRWEKLAPGRSLPPKSALRMLQLGDAAYLKVYERLSEYLLSAKLLAEQKKSEPLPAGGEAAVPGREGGLHTEIQNLLDVSGGGANDAADEDEEYEQYDEYEEEPAPPVTATTPMPEGAPPPLKPATEIRTVGESLARSDIEQFSLAPAKDRANTPRVAKTTTVAPRRLHTPSGTQAVSSITSLFDQVSRSEDLLSQLLESLISEGPFEKSAIIVVSKDRRSAIVVAARGPRIGNGQRLELDDPLSPLSQCFTKVQSFGTQRSKASPFGSKAFAVAPIDADHETPVALYADCGNEGSLSFEARRIFRTVVEVLNEKLPTIPGGIPIELKQG